MNQSRRFNRGRKRRGTGFKHRTCTECKAKFGSAVRYCKYCDEYSVKEIGKKDEEW